MRLAGRSVAITGASSGIGREAALAFARAECRLALAARNREALQEVTARAKAAGAPEVLAHPVDVRQQEDLEAWAKELGASWSGQLDVLVANAGVGHFGAFLAMDPGHMHDVLDTNVLGVWRTVHAFGPMLEAARGHVIVVSSVAGKVPLPYLSTYCATKAALVGWTRSVRPELRRKGIAITLFDPGATRTEFGRNALRSTGTKRNHVDRHIQRWGWAAPRVARAMVRAARWRPKEVDLTPEGIAGVVAAKLFPNTLASALERFSRPP